MTSCLDEDALAAEIARLEAELGMLAQPPQPHLNKNNEWGLVLTPHELAKTVEQRPLLRHKASQRDYVDSGESYCESDDECSHILGGMSYDEITVDTADLEADELQSLKQQPRSLLLSPPQKQPVSLRSIDESPSPPQRKAASLSETLLRASPASGSRRSSPRKIAQDPLLASSSKDCRPDILVQVQQLNNSSVAELGTSSGSLCEEEEDDLAPVGELDGQLIEDEIRRMQEQMQYQNSASSLEQEADTPKKKKKVLIRKTRKRTTTKVDAGAHAKSSLAPTLTAGDSSSVMPPRPFLVEIQQRQPKQEVAVVTATESHRQKVAPPCAALSIDDDTATRMKLEIQTMQAQTAVTPKPPATPARAPVPAGLLAEIQKHKKPANLLAQIQQRKPAQEAGIASTSNSSIDDAEFVAPSNAAPKPPAHPARPAAPAGLLAEIQKHTKPANLLAHIQQRKKPEQEAVTSPTASTTSSSIDEEAARLEAEIERMQAEIAAAKAAPKSPKTRKAPEQALPPARPPMLNLLGAIEQAATSRVKRLEETDGELIMQEIVPEVEVKKSAPQLSTSMAEMISQRAAARDKRLAEGGEKRMRKVVIKEKDEYKKEFSNIVTDAAAMGRLTRLNEYTVEAVAQEKTPEEQWKSNGLLAIQWRSSHMSVIHEAAQAGNAFKLPEHVVSNFPEIEQEWDPEAAGKPMSPRMRQLLELDKHVGEGQQKVDRLVLGRKEEQGKLESLLIKPMQAYSNIEDVKLPRRAPPKIDPAKNAEKLSKMKKEALMGGRPMIDISAGVAEIAWERRARLDRPGSLPKIREVCPCPYCGTASPYQTFAYREIERKHKEELLQRRQARLQAHEKQHGHAEDESTSVAFDEDVEVDEVERKRRERQRIREERRKLKLAVAEAEAAVAEAQAAADAHKAQQQTTLVTGHNARQQAAPEAAKPVSEASSVVKDRVSQWNASPPAKSPYAQQPPAVDAGCKCVIM
jgi:hypothetical protein